MPRAPRQGRRNAHREDGEQQNLFLWARLNEGRWPELALLFAVPNGAFLAGDEKARARQAARLKAQGMKPGVPDVLLPVARGSFHGLAIEMKAEGGKTRPEQVEWLEALGAQGWAVSVCFGWHPAAELLTRYLSGRAAAEGGEKP